MADNCNILMRDSVTGKLLRDNATGKLMRADGIPIRAIHATVDQVLFAGDISDKFAIGQVVRVFGSVHSANDGIYTITFVLYVAVGNYTYFVTAEDIGGPNCESVQNCGCCIIVSQPP